MADLGFLKGGFRFRRITVIIHHGRRVCLCRSVPIHAKRGNFSEFRTFEIASAGFFRPHTASIGPAVVETAASVPPPLWG